MERDESGDDSYRTLVGEEAYGVVLSEPDSAIIDCLCGDRVPDALHVSGDGTPKACTACGRVYRVAVQVSELPWHSKGRQESAG